MGHTSKRRKASHKTFKNTSNSSPLKPTQPLPLPLTPRAESAPLRSNSSRRSSLSREVSLHAGGLPSDDERPAKRARLSNGLTDDSRTYASEDGHQEKQPQMVLPSGSPVDYEQQSRISERTLGLANPHGGTITKMPSATSNDFTGVIGSAVDASESIDHAIQQPPLSGLKSPTVCARKPSESQRASPVPDVLSNNSLQSTPVRASFEDTQDSEKQEAFRVVKRLPGRKRAPNPNVRIEADLRRQLQLRTTYRSVAKALKPVLAELARRNIEEIKNDPEAHERGDHFEPLNTKLNLRLHQRLDVLKRSHQLKLGNLKQKHESEKTMVNQQYKDKFHDIQAKFVLEYKHDILKTLRDSQRQVDSDLTDDEDTPIRQLRATSKLYESDDHPGYWSVAAGLLPEAFDSRSRRFIEAELRWHEMIRRFELQRLQQKYEPTSTVHQKGEFVTFDKDRRNVGLAILNLNTLAQALYEVEAEATEAISKVDFEDDASKEKVVSNDKAVALWALAEVSEAVGPAIQPAQKLPKTENGSFLPELPDATTSPVTNDLRLRVQKRRPSTLGRTQGYGHAEQSYLQGEHAENHSVPNHRPRVNEQRSRLGKEEIMTREVTRRPSNRQLLRTHEPSSPLAAYAELDHVSRRDGRVLPLLAAKPLISLPGVAHENSPAFLNGEGVSNTADAPVAQLDKKRTTNGAAVDLNRSEKRIVQRLPQRSEQIPRIASKRAYPETIERQLTTNSDGVSQQPSQSTTPPGSPRYLRVRHDTDKRRPQILGRGLEGSQRPLQSLGTSCATAAQKGWYTAAHISSNEARPHLHKGDAGPETWPVLERKPIVHTAHSHYPQQMSTLNHGASYAAGSRPEYGHGYASVMSSHNAPPIDNWRRDPPRLQTFAPEYQTSYQGDYYAPPYNNAGHQAPEYDYPTSPFLAPRPAAGHPYAQDRYGWHQSNQSAVRPPPPGPSHHSYYRYQQPPASRHYSVPALHAAQAYGPPILPATMDPNRARGHEPQYEQHPHFHHHHSQSYPQHAPPPPPPSYVNAFPSDDSRRRNWSQSDQSNMNHPEYHGQYHR